jgi:hypothetical protein
MSNRKLADNNGLKQHLVAKEFRDGFGGVKKRSGTDREKLIITIFIKNFRQYIT